MSERPVVTQVRLWDQESYFGLLSELLGEGRKVSMTPKGESMLPFIRGDRDSVTLERLSRPPVKGDIVLARVGETYVMHRVHEVEGDSLTLMGDGNVLGKERCSAADVLGVVTEVRREGGRVVKPGKGRLWRFLRPVRRYLLAFYKRVLS